ncbi:MAG: invasin domain 3-containing protein [Armatimonadota bacterium]
MTTRILRLLLLLALVCCGGLRPAHAAGSIRVTVSPNVLLADGISTTTVTAEVRNSNGRPARDGTEVRFYTTAGTITQVAFTSAGVARATLTSSAVPQAANISVSAGLDQSVITVPMVSKLVEANVGGRVMRITGKYVAYSEDKRYIQADDQVRVKYRGVTLEANSVQIDLNQDTVKALGKIQIASDDKTMVGERLWWNLKTFEGYILAVGDRQWFSAYGLTELPERPKEMNPDFDLVDISDSKLVWVADQANYVVGERVQVQGARAYVGGIKSIRMPFHQSHLNGGGSFGTGTDQYVGLGTEGLSLNIPLYVRMTPGSSTAFNVGYGSRGGVGYFNRNNGLNIDLVQRYGFSGASEGEAALTNINSLDRWGFQWNHMHQVTKSTRLVTNLQFPSHRDLYAQANLTQGLPIGTLQLAVSGQKPQRAGFSKTYQIGFESKPKPLLDGKVGVSFEASAFGQDKQDVRLGANLSPAARRAFRGNRIAVPARQYQSFGIRARPASLSLGSGLTLDSSVSLRAVTGTIGSSFGPSFETTVRKQLGNNGFIQAGLRYNNLTTISDVIPNQGKLGATFNAMVPVGSRFKLSAFGTMALDATNHHSLLQASYQLSDKWRLDFLHSLFQFGEFGNFDYQLGIARMLGDRELGLYWSHREHRVLVEFGAARF